MKLKDFFIGMGSILDLSGSYFKDFDYEEYRNELWKHATSRGRLCKSCGHEQRSGEHCNVCGSIDLF